MCFVDRLPNIQYLASFSKIFQLVFAFAPLIYITKEFDSLVDALALTVLGFITFSLFYSPQYCLWIIPFLCFRPSTIKSLVAIVFMWATYFYFPFAYYARQLSSSGDSLFKWSITIVTICRIILIIESFWSLKSFKRLNE